MDRSCAPGAPQVPGSSWIRRPRSFPKASSISRHNEGLEIVRACRRRYDGATRNPFNEVEAGHWYARAMASYSLLQALSGARYDAVEKVLHLSPAIKGDFRCFISTATDYGTVGVRGGRPFLEVVAGEISHANIRYTPQGAMRRVTSSEPTNS